MKILSGLSEGQVLQRVGSAGANVELAGECQAKGKISATLLGKRGAVKGWKMHAVGISRGGRFSLRLRGIPAGGPYRLELRVEKETTTCRSFYVGDVWLMAGQSNMEGCGWMSEKPKPHPQVRAFSMAHAWSLAQDPLHFLAESPDACHSGGTQLTPAAAAEAKRKAQTGVGAGIFFGQEMVRLTGVPQGLIATAHGGTSMTQWDPAAKDCMYASMLRSVRATGQPVAGMLWYQGESEANPTEHTHYTERMKRLAAASRRDLGQPGLPWVIVQLAHVCDPNDGTCWNSVQEQQRLLPKVIRKLETVAAIDLGLDDMIHIGSASFPALGKRLARAANLLVHGKGTRPPQLKKISRSGNDHSVIDVTFDSVVQGLRAGGRPHGFALTDDTGKEVPYIFKTTLLGDTVRLHCTRGTDGQALHYGHGLRPYCNITDGRGDSLPVFGPVVFKRSPGLFPFVKQWKMTGVIAAAEPLDEIPCPDLSAFATTIKTAQATATMEGFVEEHAAWQTQSGQAYFESTIKLDVPMKLRFLMGYDGPFKVWVDGEPFFEDMAGINPCRPDESNKTASLDAGKHAVVVGMDLNHGLAWGFMLRFQREGLSRAELAASSSVPTYSV